MVLELTSLDGKTYSFRDFQAKVRTQGVIEFLDPLSLGNAPETLPVTLTSENYFGKELNQLESQTLNADQKEVCEHLIKIRKHLTFFDRKVYDSLKKDAQNKNSPSYGRELAEKYAENYGIQLAKLFGDPKKGFMKSYVDQKGNTSTTNLLEYFIARTKTPMVQDLETKIWYPHGIKIKRGDEVK